MDGWYPTPAYAAIGHEMSRLRSLVCQPYPNRDAAASSIERLIYYADGIHPAHQLKLYLELSGVISRAQLELYRGAHIDWMLCGRIINLHASGACAIDRRVLADVQQRYGALSHRYCLDTPANALAFQSLARQNRHPVLSFAMNLLVYLVVRRLSRP